MVSTSALAATPDTKSTNVKYEVTQSYEWSVPSEIDFDKDKGINQSVSGTVKNSGENKVKVTKNVIAEGKQLNITATGSGTNGAFTIKNGDKGTETLVYTVTKDSDTAGINAGDTILSVDSGTNTGDVALTFTLKTTSKSAEVAGSYSGTVTYTASVDDKSAN